MKSLFIFLAGIVMLGMGFSSCGKSCGSLGWTVGVQDELNNISAASIEYSQNPTPANCQAYREAYLDYIDALRSWDNCVQTTDRASWQQYLNEAEQNADDLKC